MAFLKPNSQFDLWPGEGGPRKGQYFKIGRVMHKSTSGTAPSESQFRIRIATERVLSGCVKRETYLRLNGAMLRTCTLKEARELDSKIEACKVLENL